MNAVMQDTSVSGFETLNLAEPVLRAVQESGYTTPSPIQAQIIPLMLEGRDVLGQAQTGTGKTAAFALPILSRIDLSRRALQVLVLAPTRELAMQVRDNFARYAAHLEGLRVVPIYGGKGYAEQLSALRQGVQIIVGTPGRVMDHMRSGKLSLDNLTTLVLDEADEMLRMGFIDDVEWILERCPQQRQIALLSATMPKVIRDIAQRYLNNPAEVTVKSQTVTAPLIKQRFWMASGMNKLDAITRILEQKRSDGVIVFTRTKTGTTELAESLVERGFSAVALNGDIAQRQREQTISQLKSGRIDILVATDVAARGLDVERISHVINYDIPTDPESYVHRIGRTGRAGREGEAILFVAPREMRMLSVIERVTRQRIERMELPTTAEINSIRLQNFTDSVAAAVEKGGFEMFQEMLGELARTKEIDPLVLAAALAKMAQGDKPFLLPERADDGRAPEREEYQERPRRRFSGEGRPQRGGFRPRFQRQGGERDGERREYRPSRNFRGRGEGREERPNREGNSLRSAPRHGDRPFSEKPRGERSFGEKSFSDKPRGERPFGERSFSDKPRGERSFSDKPRGERSFGDRKPYGDRGPRSSGGPRGERFSNRSRQR